MVGLAEIHLSQNATRKYMTHSESSGRAQIDTNILRDDGKVSNPRKRHPDIRMLNFGTNKNYLKL